MTTNDPVPFSNVRHVEHMENALNVNTGQDYAAHVVKSKMARSPVFLVMMLFAILVVKPRIVLTYLGIYTNISSPVP